MAARRASGSIAVRSSPAYVNFTPSDPPIAQSGNHGIFVDDLPRGVDPHKNTYGVWATRPVAPRPLFSS
jgi:hypothetical protein